MAGTLNVDTLKADSNLKLQIASANVAFIDANGLTIVGNSLNVGGGKIVVTSNNSISTPSLIGANLVTATGTTALGITANGQITTANAPFILTGGQLQFPATQIASGDGNCLDDYEEGTWTPILGGSGGSSGQTYAIQRGKYTKIGRFVMVNFDVQVTTLGTVSGSYAIVSGLPFAAQIGGNIAAVPVFGYWGGLASGVYTLAGEVDDNATFIYIAGTTASQSTVTFFSTSILANNTRLSGSVAYQTT
jgi:hypothetical protein